MKNYNDFHMRNFVSTMQFNSIIGEFSYDACMPHMSEFIKIVHLKSNESCLIDRA